MNRSQINPPRSPPTKFCIGVRVGWRMRCRCFDISIVILAEPILKTENIIGFMHLTQVGSVPGVSFIDRAMAQKDFGPLLYDTVAKYLGTPLSPSGNLSRQAESFWAKQPNLEIRPLTRKQAVAKYGSYPWEDTPIYALSEEQEMGLQEVFCLVYNKTSDDRIWGQDYKLDADSLGEVSPKLGPRKRKLRI